MNTYRITIICHLALLAHVAIVYTTCAVLLYYRLGHLIFHFPVLWGFVAFALVDVLPCLVIHLQYIVYNGGAA